MRLIHSAIRLRAFTFCFIFLALLCSACAATRPATGKTVSKTMPASMPSSYLIGPGDHLSISVWKEDNMQLEVLVAPDGSISYPLAGEIKASGLTTEQLRKKLVSKLKRYIPDPVVTVSVLQSLSNKVYVVGKVARPGEYTATGYLDVLQVLSLAGGVTPYADASEIKIVRRTSTGTKVFHFDYDEVASGEQLGTNIVLKAGDTVVVP